MRLLSLILFIGIAGFTSFAQFDIPPKPSIHQGDRGQKAVYDYAGVLDDAQIQSLERKLIGYADSTSTQIVIVSIDSLIGEDISMLGAQWAQSWGIGQAEQDNGVFILFALKDRRIDINTGYGIEYLLTDRMAEQIINRIIVPNFKTENYYKGLDEAIDEIISVLSGNYTETRLFKKNPSDGIPWSVVLFLIIMLIIFIAGNRNRPNRGNRNKGSGPDLWDVIILSRAGRSGWGSGSFGGGSSGGGFGGGFGGGGFGGGGASGSW